MKSKNSYTLPCVISQRLMIFGLFAVICQFALSILYIDFTHPTAELALLTNIFLPYLETSIVSVTLILGGALLIDYSVSKS